MPTFSAGMVGGPPQSCLPESSWRIPCLCSACRLRTPRPVVIREPRTGPFSSCCWSYEEFDFGRTRWDLIAIIYALEKRSVHRVREALKPGGLVVVEAGHSETSGAPFEYHSNELLQIFEGFRILRYEDTGGTYDWGPETIRLVRLVAQKPR